MSILLTNRYVLLLAIVMCMLLGGAGVLRATSQSQSSDEVAEGKIVKRASRFLGPLLDDCEEPMAVRTVLDETTEYFRTRRHEGVVAWRVNFGECRFDTGHLRTAGQNSEPRRWVVFIDSATGDLMRIVSRTDDYSDSAACKTHPVDTDLLWNTSEERGPTPKELPAFSLAEVLDRMGGYGGMEMVCLYKYIYNHNTDETNPGWIIHLYGLEPMTVFDREGHSLPLAQATHVRIRIDATTGDRLGHDYPPLMPPAPNEK